MASNPPAECCIKAVKKEGETVGSYAEVCGINTYVSGEKSKKVVVIFSDIFGYKFKNNMLIADRFAEAGYYTLIPDMFHDDPFPLNETVANLGPWLKNHSPPEILAMMDTWVTELKKDLDFEFLGVVGHCFGSIMAMPNVAEGKLATCAAIAHPSGVSMDSVAAVVKPLLISAAETDVVFPDELRHQTEAKLKENKIFYQVDVFAGVEHGYAVRGDESIPQVKYAKEKTILDQIYWFDNFSS